MALGDWFESDPFDISNLPVVEEVDPGVIIPVEEKEWPLLSEIRIGPLSTPVDFATAHNEQQDKMNEVIRALNSVLDHLRSQS